MNEPSLTRDLAVLIPVFFATWFAALHFARRRSDSFKITGPGRHLAAMLRLGLVFAFIEWIAIDQKVSFGYCLAFILVLALALFVGAFASDAEGGIFIVGVGVFVYQWVFWYPAAEKMTSTDSIAGESTRPPDHLIGKRGTTTAPLRPSGRVAIDDQQYDAESELGFIDAGIEFEVIALKDTRLVVRKV